MYTFKDTVCKFDSCIHLCDHPPSCVIDISSTLTFHLCPSCQPSCTLLTQAAMRLLLSLQILIVLELNLNEITWDPFISALFMGEMTQHSISFCITPNYVFVCVFS